MSQLDKIHYGLTTLNFWRIVLCNFVFVLSVIMVLHREAMGAPWLLLTFAGGCILPGPFCGWMLDHYRRRFVVIWAICLFVLLQFPFLSRLLGGMVPAAFSFGGSSVGFAVGILSMVLQGVCFGVFQIAMGSTILIDSTASEKRQPASYIYFASCFSGLMCALCANSLLAQLTVPRLVLYLPAVLAFAAVVLISRLKLPFRSPQNISFCSMDRFLLLRTWPLALNYVVCFTAACTLLSIRSDCYAILVALAGSLLAYLGHGVFFRDADSRAEVMVGLICLVISSLILLGDTDGLFQRVSMGFLGYGVGAFSNRYQNMFSQVAEHCERGRAHSTFTLCQILSICFGFFFGMSMQEDYHSAVVISVAVVFILALLSHQLVLQRWCQSNKRR